MPSALLTATVMSHIAQFHGPAITLLQQRGYEVHIAARDNLAVKHGLALPEVDRVFDVPFERSPIHPRNLQAARHLFRILGDTEYNIIHCNTPVAGVLTRILSQRARTRGAKLVYTAHGFHFFEGSSWKNWLAYYPLEFAMARHTDVLVTINTEDYARAKRFPAARIAYLPGVGVDIDRFSTPDAAAGEVRAEFGLPPKAVVVLSVGELNDNKNHGTVIRALARLDNPSIHYLICGNGPRREQLGQLARELGVENRTHFLGYRRDIPRMLAAADIFCLPSFREGLPLSVMEAMASGTPVVAARIRGVADLIDPGKGGILVARPDSAEGFADAISSLASDLKRRQAMGAHNWARVTQFSTRTVAAALQDVYDLSLPADGGSRCLA